ncbi:zinc finger MYM-type protein 5-like [Papaver somniferum]|uniref:zinc finger MYM-type protein 5-like n=1 Tax=Papaver somniferum TaxID=3469 RepID=UPI000E6F56E1|nr:zinc finger MYM-type protein 5-like [Papaver somniferum]
MVERSLCMREGTLNNLGLSKQNGCMPPLKRKQLSGCQNRKRSKKIEEFKKSLAGSLEKYVVKTSAAAVVDNVNVVITDTVENVNHTLAENVAENVDTVGLADGGDVHEANENHNNVNINEQVNDMDGHNTTEFNMEEPNQDMFDPKNCGKIDQKMIDFLIENGPRRVEDYVFPYDKFRKRFSRKHYTRKMTNWERQDRIWLVYSTSLNKVFCFCCKLFKRDDSIQFADIGFDDWNNLSGRLKKHETCSEHEECMRKWIHLELRLKKNETIDKQVEEQINKEKQRFIEIMDSVMDVVMYLAKNCLAFRGESDKIFTRKMVIF